MKIMPKYVRETELSQEIQLHWEGLKFLCMIRAYLCIDLKFRKRLSYDETQDKAAAVNRVPSVLTT